MTRGHTVCGLVSLAILCLVSPALGAIQLTQVASGLSSPVFVGHAGDGSQRLFIEERGGIIRVMDPGKAPTIFLDIRDRIKSGGEMGMQYGGCDD